MRSSIAGICLLLAGAGAGAAQEAAPPTVSFTVLDARAEADKKQKNLSLIITNCSYGILRLGEKKAPGRFDALRTDLVAIKGAALEGKTLHVSRYDLFLDNSVWLRETVGSQYSGVLMEALKKQGVNCPREKMKGGWFEASELTTPNPPLIIEMRVTLDGLEHDVRVVHSSNIAMGGNFTKEDAANEYHAALRKVANALAAQLP